MTSLNPQKRTRAKRKKSYHYCTKESFALQKIHYFVVKTPAFLFCTKNFHLFILKKDPRISFTLRVFVPKVLLASQMCPKFWLRKLLTITSGLKSPKGVANSGLECFICQIKREGFWFTRRWKMHKTPNLLFYTSWSLLHTGT